MNYPVKQLGKNILIGLVALLIVGSVSSCKSKKKLAMEQAAAEYAIKVDQAKQDLTAMLNDDTSWTLDERVKRLETIKSFNIDDPEVKDLISKVEVKLANERIELERKAEEERLRKEEEAKIRMIKSEYSVIDNQLSAVANAATVDAANNSIQSALQYFATPDVPLLIIISKADGFNDYDRPTTILKFLNYLKDKKQYQYLVESVERDAMGKITEIELIKK